MDKFGIFKLLNSFLNFCQQNKVGLTSNNSQNSNQLNLSNAISSLLKKDSQAPKSDQEKSSPPSSNKFQSAPLQQSMLSVMAEHDKFIKRVKQNNPSK